MSKKMLFKDFIILANERYNNKFTYDETSFNGSHTKMRIICPKHGEFWQAPRTHLKYLCGCPSCSYEYRAKNYTSTTNEFISKALKVHGNKYDYSEVEYVNVNLPIKIVCHNKDRFGNEHGIFYQTPNDHLNGNGCSKCSSSHFEMEIKNLLDLLCIKYIWQYKDKELLGKQSVDFLLSEYNLAIECQGKQHFKDGCWSKDYTHENIKICDLNKNNVLTKNGIKVIYLIPNFISKPNKSFYTEDNTFYMDELKDYIIKLNYKNYISNIKLDFYSYLKTIHNNVEIENDDEYVISDKNKKFILVSSLKYKENDKILLNKKNCDYDTYVIYDDEWFNKRNICKSRINNILGLQKNKIFARKCVLKEINNKTSKEFCSKNHIQGSVNSEFSFGLFYDDELISVMTFGKLRKNLGSKNKINEYELLRFCNKIDYQVVGGASKLLNHFIKTIKPLSIISYCDRRWSNGNLYIKLGFRHSHTSNPSYYYLINGDRKNRFSYRKDILIKKYDCPKEISEHNFCLSKGWYRIYDCGCECYKLILNDKD